MPARATALTLCLLIFAAGAAGCLETPSPSIAPNGAPLPLDPLNETERTRAMEIASSDPAVSDLLAGRHRVIGAALRTDKENILSETPARLADVHIYRYDTDDVVWVIVAVDTGSVTAVDVRRFQPQLVYEEISEAQALALAHAEVAEALGEGAPGAQVAAILTSGRGAAHPCARHRCVELYFNPAGESPLFCLVDLSRMTVVDVQTLAERLGGA